MNNFYCVIMSGGIGSRFWPASRSAYPKQFLDFFGTGKSLIQQTFDRFKQIVPVENIYVVTNRAYRDLTLEQLPELSPRQVLLEPCRRNTAPCIAFASYHIKALNPKANIVVSPADHLVLDEATFVQTIKEGLQFVATRPVLLTIGIQPNRPETGYGYIQTSRELLDGFTKVKAFTEKPNLELAKVFLESGDFLWNSGIFLWNVEAILKAFDQLLPEVAMHFKGGEHYFNTESEESFIEQTFPSCPNLSIDYGIMEKADNVFVQKGNFGWSDLGTWGSLHELSEKDSQENAALKCQALFYESSGNLVSMPEDMLAVVQKLDGYIVTLSDKVLMICKKEDEQEIRQFVMDAQMKVGDRFV